MFEAESKWLGWALVVSGGFIALGYPLGLAPALIAIAGLFVTLVGVFCIAIRS